MRPLPPHTPHGDKVREWGILEISNERGGNSSMDTDYRHHITLEPGKRSGQPCIRGLRMTVYDVLSYLAAGMSIEEVLQDFSMLTRDDVLACLSYAAQRERYTLVVQ